MATYRERREAKADRLDEWAEKREAKQAALDKASRADEATTGIPFGQPILVGHHSERRHRNAIARIDRAMGAAVDNSRKAQSMAGRADAIRAQAAGAIYSDDPDAIEALTAKIARLEAQREAIKARNAEFRKANRAALKQLASGYERDLAMPHRSYELTNLTGNIGRLRKRLDGLKREAERGPSLRTITARYDGPCADCGAELCRGELIRYARSTGALCAPACATTTNEEE